MYCQLFGIVHEQLYHNQNRRMNRSMTRSPQIYVTLLCACLLLHFCASSYR